VLEVERIDHVVLHVASVERRCAFYARVLGLEVVRFGADRRALRIGDQKINVRPLAEVRPPSRPARPRGRPTCASRPGSRPTRSFAA